ncbi:hypothetical protein B0H14DRAFT_3118129 [Mycena olivaceomarginata]|nr:hypothetical protein B0H14DRAFT_3118129 [Mycena olivaceomarginata]
MLPKPPSKPMISNWDVRINTPPAHYCTAAPNHPGMQSGGSTISVFKKVAARGLEQLEIERAIATAEDEDSDDRSGRTATSPPLDASDSESDTPILLLRWTARRAKFNSTSAPPSPASPAY